MDFDADELRTKFTAKCWELGLVDRLPKAAFKALVSELMTSASGGKMPSDKDLEVAFGLAVRCVGATGLALQRAHVMHHAPC